MIEDKDRESLWGPPGAFGGHPVSPIAANWTVGTAYLDLHGWPQNSTTNSG